MNLHDSIPSGQSRREFIRRTILTAAGVTAGFASSLPGADHGFGADEKKPWYRSALRWGQTNITEIDPARYDIDWWRKQWRRTRTQAVIINAGGIVAYYPSKVPLHRLASQLAGRDLFGELCQAAHREGLVVLARMDSNRAHEELYQAHPGWFAVDGSGRPHRAGDLFITCVNGPYYEAHIPAILREIAERYHPEGFTDNSWSGLGRGTICYCENCRNKFLHRSGKDIPLSRNWNDPTYREWIRWNYDRRLEIWDLNNRVTKAAGGPHCIWSGMNSGSITGQSQSFRDYKRICERAEIIMLDHQARSDDSGFQNNGEIGKLIHGILGWNKLIPESMAMYQAGKPTFRLSSKPASEARLWMLDGIAGGLQPWWHHIGAYHEDRRMYQTAEPVYNWHNTNEEFLVNRQPTAAVGVVWSQENTDFFGRDDAGLLVELPWRGTTLALVRGRIPYLPVHADNIDRDGARLSGLILPNVGALSDSQIAAIRRFVERGGGLLATGESTLYNESGDPRPDFGLADIFGVHVRTPGNQIDGRKKAAAETAHTYLRLNPELRANVDGPHIEGEPAILGQRHPVLRGFEKTDIIPYGGELERLDIDPDAQPLLTFIPAFPIYPPETAWMRQPKTDIAGLLVKTLRGGARVAFLPADIDRRFARDNLPDHGDLLGNIIRWISKDKMPFEISGPGLIDCHLYQQPGRLILHLVNLTNTGTWRQPVDELIPVGPLKVRIKVSAEIKGHEARFLVADRRVPTKSIADWRHFTIPSILDHEVVVIGKS